MGWGTTWIGAMHGEDAGAEAGERERGAAEEREKGGCAKVDLSDISYTHSYTFIYLYIPSYNFI